MSNGFVRLVLLSIIYTGSAFAETIISSDIKFIDGDSLVVAGYKIRLEGIDAPEYSQTCYKNNENWRCGVESTIRLKKLIGNRPLKCISDSKDHYGRLLATCWIENININQWMVLNGWAVAFLKYSDLYSNDEHQAKEEIAGIWSSEFIRPNEYRHSSYETAVINSPNKQCAIKGNINSKGIKIYHTPWNSDHYNRTRISASKGERWFCSESEALAAGWRALYR